MTSASKVPLITLNDGTKIPQLGFGVYQIERNETYKYVSKALDVGYSHIDTAQSYANEKEVGKAVRDYNKYVFVTTKYFNPNASEHGYENAKAYFRKSFKTLGLDHIDLYLIHFPVIKNEVYVDAWKAFVELQKTEKLRSIGVSNFTTTYLKKIIDETGVTPSVNQVECHPYLQQNELRKFHEEHGIVTESWSPLGRGDVLDDKILKQIGKKHNKTAAQVVLRWHIQIGNVTFPKSVNTERIEENFDIFDFSLSEEEMESIKKLDKNERNGPDPAEFQFPDDFLEKRQQESQADQ
ncbi:MAG TPA: aldo/keto reductase [Leeuwenhoekiella sp.]|nr:aldo/keto reductase [Leeuwenhoekiella sp.]